MFFIGGISNGKCIFDFSQTMVCKQCGHSGTLTVFMTYWVFTFFFIPIFKWKKQYFAETSCCHTIYSLPNHIGKAIAQGQQITIVDSDLTPIHQGNHIAYCPECGYPLQSDFTFCPKCGHKLF